jgi:hypothetical protein
MEGFVCNMQKLLDCWVLKEGDWTAWPSKMVLTGCPETLVTDYHSTCHKIPKGCRSHWLHGGSLKSCVVTIYWSCWTKCVKMELGSKVFWSLRRLLFLCFRRFSTFILCQDMSLFLWCIGFPWYLQWFLVGCLLSKRLYWILILTIKSLICDWLAMWL